MKTLKLFKKNKLFTTILMLMIFSLTVSPLLVLADNSNSAWQVKITATTPNDYTGNLEKTSFMPGELVNIKANITNNGQPRANIEVFFKVEGPKNSANPITVYRSAKTNNLGIAEIDFRFPNGTSGNQVLGEWAANCTVDTIDYSLTGNLKMNVRWPSLSQEINMLNETGTKENVYVSGQTSTIKITAQNSENQSFTGDIIVNITDTSSQIGQISFENVTISNGTNIFENNITIPDAALIGQAKIESNIYVRIDENNKYLANTTAVTFTIANKTIPDQNQIDTVIHDVAITSASVKPSIVFTGDIVEIVFTVANLGNATSEDVKIGISHQNGVIANLTVPGLGPNSPKVITYRWNTTEVPIGDYTIAVNAQPVTGENDLSNNQFSAGVISINYQTIYQTTQLFSVFLVITGIFAFSLLFMFVRREKASEQNNNLSLTPKPI